MHSKGLHQFKVERKILLTDRHKQLRIDFCRKMLDLPDEELNMIIFGDQLTVALDKISGKQTYWSLESKPELNQKRSNYVRKQMFWCCFSSSAMGPIVAVHGS